MRHDLAGKAFGDDPALIEHDDAIGQRDDDAHDVLDENDRRALLADLPDELHRAVDLARGEPRQYFVEEEQPRARRERARELEKLALVQVEESGQRLRSVR